MKTKIVAVAVLTFLMIAPVLADRTGDALWAELKQMRGNTEVQVLTPSPAVSRSAEVARSYTGYLERCMQAVGMAQTAVEKEEYWKLYLAGLEMYHAAQCGAAAHAILMSLAFAGDAERGERCAAEAQAAGWLHIAQAEAIANGTHAAIRNGRLTPYPG